MGEVTFTCLSYVLMCSVMEGHTTEKLGIGWLGQLNFGLYFPTLIKISSFSSYIPDNLLLICVYFST